jgi:hypothetical protein
VPVHSILEIPKFMTVFPFYFFDAKILFADVTTDYLMYRFSYIRSISFQRGNDLQKPLII